MANCADSGQLASAKGRVYPGSAGQALILTGIIIIHGHCHNGLLDKHYDKKHTKCKIQPP